MIKHLTLRSLILLFLLCFALPALPATAGTDSLPWSTLFYVGSTAKQEFGDTIVGKFTPVGENIYSWEVAYTLAQQNLVRRIFSPIVDTTEIAGNVTYRHDYKHHDGVKEGNIYFIWRWTQVPFMKTEFPWSRYINTTFAVGDGMSYASHPPFADREPGHSENDFSKLLNYLMMEITFAAPSHPELQLALRLHHRCTAWGTYPKNPNAGSTSIGLGIRYYFGARHS